MKEEEPPLPTKPTPEPKGPGWRRNRRRTALIVFAPIVSVATLMIGLRVGAGETVRAASVFAAPPGMPSAPGAPVPFTWQVLTYLEDRGVRETIGMRDLTVIARSKGNEARWSGSSNVDGIAEAVLSLPGLTTNDPVDLEVRTSGEGAPLAEGRISWKTLPWAREPGSEATGALRPSKREGAIAIDVVVEGERLVVGFETPVWAHLVSPSGPLDQAHVDLTPEAGLRLEKDRVKVGCDIWAEIGAIAQGPSGIQIDAKAADGRTGVWFGALPIAAGAFFIGAPRFVPAGKAEPVVLVAPNPRNVVYAEVDDEHGRVFAAALPLAVEKDDPVPRARFTMPPLAAGLHWLVVSGEPRGAEHLAGAAIAKPFLVGGGDLPPNVRPAETCSIGPWLARRPPVLGFRRWLALDGMATRGASNRMRHRLGLVIGLGSLLVAAVLEVLLLTAASREARAIMLLAELDEGEEWGPGESPREKREQVVAEPPGGGLAVALLVAMLGFALLAALMIAKG